MTTDMLDVATAYTEKRHWYVVPVKPGDKKPPIEGWQDLRLEVEDLPRYFSNGAAIGVLCGEPSGNLVDIDLDCGEALPLASAFLPKTALQHGRPGRPRSHYWYECNPLPKTTKYRDPRKTGSGAMIVEFRSTNSQTVLPPSPHPEGGCYAWDFEGKPTQLDGNDLREAAAQLAAACLLVRYWPSKGSRQDAALALSGGLLRAGWEQDTVSHFVQAVATAAGDEEARMRASTAKASEKRLDRDRPATGWPTLAEFIGADIIDKVTEWLGIAWSADETPIVFGKTTEPEWPADAAPEAFYGLAGEIVSELDPYTEADKHAVLTGTLIAFANAIGPRPHFQVSATRHWPRTNAVVVGATGKGRKGDAWALIRRLFVLAAPEWTANCIVGGLSSGEGLIYEVRDPVTKREAVKEKGKVVGYQDVVVDEGVTDKRRLVLESEFARVLRVQSRDGNILSTIVRQSWDDDVLRVLTKQSPVQSTGCHISILGQITPEDLSRYLNDTEAANGYGNRFVWQVVRRSKLLPDGASVPHSLLEGLAGRLAEAIEFGQSVDEMQRDEGARGMWHAVYPDLTNGKPGMVGALLGRAEAQVMRLACCYSLLDLSATVHIEHLMAALALWERAEASVWHIFGDVTGDPVADAILRALRVQGPLTLTAIRDLFSRHVKADRIAKALNMLAEAALAAVEKEATGGRPSVTWRAL